MVQRLEISVRDSLGNESFEDISNYDVRFKEGDGIAFLKETASTKFVYLENTTTGEAYSFKFDSRPSSAFKGFLIGMMSAIVVALIVFLGGYGVAKALVNDPPPTTGPPQLRQKKMPAYQVRFMGLHLIGRRQKQLLLMLHVEMAGWQISQSARKTWLPADALILRRISSTTSVFIKNELKKTLKPEAAKR